MLMDYPRISSRRLLDVLLSLTLAVLSVPAMAQSKWYAVEVVIFRHWVAPGDDAEYWPDSPQPIARPATQRLVTLGPVAGGPDAPAFSRLPHTELRLAGVRKRLERSNDYVVLLHAAWRQPAYKPANAPAVVLPLHWQPPALQTMSATPADTAVHSQNPSDQLLDGEREPPPAPADAARGQYLFDYLPAGTQLWGILQLSRRRYLHFQVDLRFRREGIGGAGESDAATIYPMTQSRRIEEGEIHYLDHPVLGVLVQIRLLQHGRERNQTPAAH